MNRLTLPLSVVAAMVLASLAGCSKEEAGANPPARGTTQSPPAPPTPAPAPGRGQGALIGRVLFEGKAPPARTIQVSKDEAECRHAAGEVQDVVVGPDKALSGVVVEIGGIKPPQGGWEWKHPAGGYVLRQKDCRFSLSLLVVPEGSDLTICNDDPVMHNVNSGQWNRAQTAGSKPFTQRIDYEGRSLIRLNCNVHSWMEMWVYVARSPFFATTGADGRFRIDGVPSGQYKVTATHPTLGTEKLQITVGDGQTADREVTFRSR